MTAVAQSRGLDIHGFVRNEADGSVTVDAEASKADMAELLRRIEAAMGDRINGTDVDSRQPMNRRGGFQIEY